MLDDGEPIRATAELWKGMYGQEHLWHILLRAPTWVLRDIGRDMERYGGVITQGNRGNGSMLLIAASWQVRHPAKDLPEPPEGADNAD